MNANVSLSAAAGALALLGASLATRFVVGHENGPLHGKTEFGL